MGNKKRKTTAIIVPCELLITPVLDEAPNEPPDELPDEPPDEPPDELPDELPDEPYED